MRPDQGRSDAPAAMREPHSIDPVCERFSQAWRQGDVPCIEDYARAGEAGQRPLFVELVLIDLYYRWRSAADGHAASKRTPETDGLLPDRPRLEDYVTRCLLRGTIGDLPTMVDWPVEAVVEEYRVRRHWGDRPGHKEYLQRFPRLPGLAEWLLEIDREPAVEVTREARFKSRNLATPNVSLTETSASQQAEPAAETLPAIIGRYRVETLLGRGGFGCVYLARDDELQRSVAIKVPHHRLVTETADADAYLAEARTVANLDHPHIVPVYDVGRTDEFPCYVVSKYIAGTTLTDRMKESRLSWAEAAQLVATVAEALHYAHTRGLVHRDVKPSNILLDPTGKPHVVDFGLALNESNGGKGSRYAGTPLYMSPEQARGEGHRVDGRSDVFSLGVVFYELLTRNKPFRGQDPYELLEAIATRDPKPPRQWDESIPAAMERACLKALAKNPANRYSTAYDFAQDLRTTLSRERDQAPSRQRQLDESLLHLIWDSLDPQLQDAFALAYNKKRRQGKDRISTRDLFEALVRVGDDQFCELQRVLPAGSLPEPIDPTVSTERRVLQEQPLLSDCVAESLTRYSNLDALPRKISCADIFVDIGKHGHGPSVVRLREHGVTPAELERHVAALRLSLIHVKHE